MDPRSAAFAAWIVVCCAALPAAAANRLSLDEAFARIVEQHPELQQFDRRADVLAAERERAAQRPALVAGALLENVAGSGEASGGDSAELTLSLASVLERGGKAEARGDVVASRIDALGTAREARRLDLLAEAARRYLSLASAQRIGELAAVERAQRQRSAEAARARHRAGGTPESAVLAAEAAVARAAMDERLAQARFETARLQLAALWGERDPDFGIDPPALLALPALPGRVELAQLLEATPDITRFADEARVREAQLALARSDAAFDLSWELGVRRLEASDDVALVAGVSVPLGARTRAGPGLRAAQAELDALGTEREATVRTLYATLAEAYGRYSVATAEVQALGSDIIPRLARAGAAAEKAYRAGAATYAEWAQIQAEHATVLRQQHELALGAWLALVEIQRLTGHAFIAPPVRSEHGDIDP